MRTAGRVLGALAALGAAALWAVFVFWNPYAPPEDRTVLMGYLMMSASTVSAAAAAKGAHLGMYLLFFAIFVPIGFYVLLGRGIFQWIGWLDLVYLAAAVLVHAGTRQKT